MPRQFLKNLPGHAVPPLGRLIRIGGRADGHFFAGTNFLEVAPQQPRRFLLYEDFVLKFVRVTHLHELVRVTRKTVLAGELTTAIRIDRPGEGKIPSRIAAVKDGANRQGEKLHLMTAVDTFGLMGQPGDANQTRCGIGFIQPKGSHSEILQYSPYVRHQCSMAGGQVTAIFEMQSARKPDGSELAENDPVKETIRWGL